MGVTLEEQGPCKNRKQQLLVDTCKINYSCKSPSQRKGKKIDDAFSPMLLGLSKKIIRCVDHSKAIPFCRTQHGCGDIFEESEQNIRFLQPQLDSGSKRNSN